ncbi:histidine phosphatase family protein [Enterovibrio sp. ZSDZ35]|uniref:Histidine phosphatase family protein n=1 Tax=Enterovibrio qingdaonensis TaxID=2899818 RepID=A0ABT5QQC4_9GAMM|nr:histidine phosphatase family protein [Enterovibrio sp. ZSDZ35]MDD1783189.1 histidine phosphatase family protein [Enterovibrio sp. ZSDZ35]
MKLLFLVRHAKSCWKDASLNDHDRPLNARGRRNAPQMGKRLAAWQMAPSLIVSSTALRARETARLIASELSASAPIIDESADVYTEAWRDLVRVIEGFDDVNQRVMLIGHNPALNQLITSLPFTIDNLPTCGVVVVALHDTKWSSWSSAKKQVLFLDYPKRLP